MGSLVTSPEKARALHLQYLERPKNFSWDGPCIEFHHPDIQRYSGQGRMSINFFAARLSQWSKVWRLVQKAHGDNHNALSDEMMLSPRQPTKISRNASYHFSMLSTFPSQV